MSEEKLLPGTIATGPTGLKWHYGGPETDDHLPILGHEMGIVNMVKHMFPEGGVFVDVGAHVGLYSLEMASKASQVIAVEANNETYNKLIANIQLNELDDKVTPVNFAVWDEATTLEMVDPNNKMAGGSNRCYPVNKKPGGMEIRAQVAATRLDKILKPYGLARVDFIKIDVEGAEARVLKGARKTLAQFHPVLLIEMHDVFMGPENRQKVEHELEAVGYKHGEDIPFGDCYSLVCRPA